MWTWGQLAKINSRLSSYHTCRIHVVKCKHWHIALSHRHMFRINHSCRSEVRWIGCLTSQLTIFQSYMWRHIDVQADWRRSWTYGRAPNAIYRHFVGFFNVPVLAPTRDHPFYTVIWHTAPFSRLLRSRWGYGGHILDLTPGPSRGKINSIRVENQILVKCNQHISIESD